MPRSSKRFHFYLTHILNNAVTAPVQPHRPGITASAAEPTEQKQQPANPKEPLPLIYTLFQLLCRSFPFFWWSNVIKAACQRPQEALTLWKRVKSDHFYPWREMRRWPHQCPFGTDEHEADWGCGVYGMTGRREVAGEESERFIRVFMLVC